MPRKDLEPRKKKYIAITEAITNIEEGYKRLAVAIVEQAAKDAKGYGYNADRTMDPGAGNKKLECNKTWQMQSVEWFFCSDDSLFSLCMPNTDGPTLYKMILHNYEVYGNYISPQQTVRGAAIVL